MKSSKSKQAFPEKDSSSLTRASEAERIDPEKALTDFSDDTITFYSTIQLIWHEYQSRISSIPCLDVLSVLSSQEQTKRKRP